MLSLIKCAFVWYSFTFSQHFDKCRNFENIRIVLIEYARLYQIFGTYHCILISIPKIFTVQAFHVLFTYILLQIFHISAKTFL